MRQVDPYVFHKYISFVVRETSTYVRSEFFVGGVFILRCLICKKPRLICHLSGKFATAIVTYFVTLP